MDAVAQIASTLREYSLTEVTGDRYAAGFNVDAFAHYGIRYHASKRDRSASTAIAFRCSPQGAHDCSTFRN
jgi:hypothetical protein